MSTGYLACTFSAIAGPGFGGWQSASSQQGCCELSNGIFVGAIGIDNSTCDVTGWVGDSAPYTLTVLARSSGSLAITDTQCATLAMETNQNGIVVTGSGVRGPLDWGLASQYGFTGCTSSRQDSSPSSPSVASEANSATATPTNVASDTKNAATSQTAVQTAAEVSSTMIAAGNSVVATSTTSPAQVTVTVKSAAQQNLIPNLKTIILFAMILVAI